MAYSFQTFVFEQVFTSGQANQTEVNIRDHVHGVSGVSNIPAASQAQMEAATSSIVAVTPAMQQNHPLSPKAWGKVTVNAASSLNAGSGLSVEFVTTGIVRVTLDNSMSTAEYGAVANITDEAPAQMADFVGCNSYAQGVFLVETVNNAGGHVDRNFAVAVWGDL